MTQVQKQTPQHPMMTVKTLFSHESTIYLSAVLKLPVVARLLLLVAACSLMYRRVLELQALFEEYGRRSLGRRLPIWSASGPNRSQ